MGEEEMKVTGGRRDGKNCSRTLEKVNEGGREWEHSRKEVGGGGSEGKRRLYEGEAELQSWL